MAEFAQLRFEEWAPIVAEIDRLGLLKRDERRKVVADVKGMEYLIQKPTRTLPQVLSYVEYQVQFLDLLESRRKESQLFEKFEEIEKKIQYRINSLFGTYERNFGDQMAFWMAKLEFAVKMKWFDDAFKIYQSAINHLGATYPGLYKKASDYEWSRNPMKNIDSARRILQEGLRSRSNRTNLDMYIWIYQLELQHADFLMTKAAAKKTSKSTEEETNFTSTANKCLEAADFAYRSAIKFCWERGRELYDRFIQVLRAYPRFYENLAEPIFKDLELNCDTEEERYNIRAREYVRMDNAQTGMDDIVFNKLLIQMNIKPSKTEQKLLRDLVSKNPSCCPKYLQFINLKDGITGVRKEFSNLVHRDSYCVLKCMADMEFRCLDHDAIDKLKRLRELMEKACMLHGKKNLDVWIDFIRYEKALRNEDKASDIYARGLKYVDSNLKEQLMLRYNTITNNP